MMTAKDLKRLLELSKENKHLRKQLQDAEKKLEAREIAIAESGSLAEAALRLSRIFEDAQAACELYEQNVRMRCEQMEKEARERCQALEASMDLSDLVDWDPDEFDLA